jgi:hypothetical protein
MGKTQNPENPLAQAPQLERSLSRHDPLQTERRFVPATLTTGISEYVRQVPSSERGASFF